MRDAAGAGGRWRRGPRGPLGVDPAKGQSPVRGGEASRPSTREEGAAARPSLRDVYLLFRPRVAQEDGERADAEHHEAGDGLPEVRRVALRVGRRGEEVELPDGEDKRGDPHDPKQNVNQALSSGTPLFSFL